MYRNLFAYKKAYELAMKIFHLSKRFPSDEKYSLTNQIRRSSRSVCTNIAEAYRRRKYPGYYISKMNDVETENLETEVWLDFSKDCGYLEIFEYNDLINLNTEVGKLVSYMIKNPGKFQSRL
jgi:four helix bundle protein